MPFAIIWVLVLLLCVIGLGDLMIREDAFNL